MPYRTATVVFEDSGSSSIQNFTVSSSEETEAFVTIVTPSGSEITVHGPDLVAAIYSVIPDFLARR